MVRMLSFSVGCYICVQENLRVQHAKNIYCDIRDTSVAVRPSLEVTAPLV